MYIHTCSQDQRQCPDRRGVFISEVHNRETPLYCSLRIRELSCFLVQCLRMNRKYTENERELGPRNISYIAWAECVSSFEIVERG